MVAPTGARKTRDDHAALPLEIDQTVHEAALCQQAGATVLHAHVRDEHGRHVLDAGLYRELIAEMDSRVPGMLVQITSEAVGRYTPAQQIECVQAVVPRMASMSLREITGGFGDTGLAQRFFAWCSEHGVHLHAMLQVGLA